MRNDKKLQIRLPETLLDKSRKEAKKRNVKLSEIIRLFLIELTKEN